jgi:hypothetical protein
MTELSSQNPEVREALQVQTIASLQNSLSALSEQVTVGFKGVHERQDVTNGRITSGEKEVALLKLQFENEKKLADQKEVLQVERGQARIRLWQTITILSSTIVALASYIIYNH